MKRVAIYLRMSTAKQDGDNQRRDLEAVAKRAGRDVVRIYEDAGISGAKGRDKRPGLDSMMRAVNAKRFDIIAARSVRPLTEIRGNRIFLDHATSGQSENATHGFSGKKRKRNKS